MRDDMRISFMHVMPVCIRNIIYFKITVIYLKRVLKVYICNELGVI